MGARAHINFRTSFVLGITAMIVGSSTASESSALTAKPRVIVTTDFPPLDVVPIKAPPGGPPEKRSDPDDIQSMVRFLLYSNEFDVEGLVASSGTLANVANQKNILAILDRYEQVYPRLVRRDKRYPTARVLRSVTSQGRSGSWGKPWAEIIGEGRDSEASNAIIRAVDKPDSRPVWVCVWGGSCEVAQAIWRVSRSRHPEEVKRFLSKLRIFLIAKQDGTADWLLENYPQLFVILSERNYMGMFSYCTGSDPKLADLSWINKNIREAHGPLGAAYPRSGWDPMQPGQQEGDSPSFLHLVSGLRGLNDPEQPDQGGWGGKFVRPDPTRNHWFDGADGAQSVYGWRREVQQEFATRAAWMVAVDEEGRKSDSPTKGIRNMQNNRVEQWDVFEVELKGPSSGNPYSDVQVKAEFRNGVTTKTVDGFYDGDGIYRVRFMPDAQGEWAYTTHSSSRALDGVIGAFTCVAPTAKNHGPVHVKGTRFAYADGSTYSCFGTTCYAWVHQPKELQDQTVATLATGPFNKLRMCVFPKNYAYNENEPEVFPYTKLPDGRFDHHRFDPAFWKNLEHRLAQLRDLGIEADIILFHPYDGGRWGFDRMNASSDAFYLKYTIARLSAYRNVWWSLANEYDFMSEKKLEDWDRFFHINESTDPYHRLRSIHNGVHWYDHSKPWVTHASVQSSDMKSANAVRDRYHKPVVYDECCYEGNTEHLWGNLSAQGMVQRFWDGFMRGCYVGHGETYLSPDDVLWWSKGGLLHGQSPARIAFLRRIFEEAPSDIHSITDMFDWEHDVIAVQGVPESFYLIYFGAHQPARKEIPLPQKGKYSIEVIDTWEMTVRLLPSSYKGKAKVDLPGKPYIALRICRIE